MRKKVTYIETYKDVKIYQYDDKKYTTTFFTKTIEEKDLKVLKVKIDEIIKEYIKKYKNLD